MWKLFDVGMAVRAAHNGVNAVLVLGLVYENTLPRCRHQIFLRVARQAIGIGGTFRLRVSDKRKAVQQQGGANEQHPAPSRTFGQFAPGPKPFT